MSLKNFFTKTSKSAHIIRRMRYLMGTFFEIEIIAENENAIKQIIELSFSEIKRIEKLLSRFINESEISLLNRKAPNHPVKISSEVFNLIELSIKYFHLTEGLFDITICPLLEVWQKSELAGYIPSDGEIKNTLQLVGLGNIVLDPDKKTVFFQKQNVKIDLGGVGKGYAIDKVVNILKKHNIQQAMINAGGQYYILGEDFDNDFSLIGIENPLKPGEIITKVELKNESISTSGNYERFFYIGEKKYGHIINPFTGYPANELNIVSVLSTDPIIADVLSTALFVMGEKGMKLVEKTPNTEAIMITTENKILYPSGLEKNSKNRFEN